jgi:formamidopyrimidine-DNA glycosylase
LYRWTGFLFLCKLSVTAAATSVPPPNRSCQKLPKVSFAYFISSHWIKYKIYLHYLLQVARITHFLRQHLVGKKISKVVAQDDSSVFGKVGTSASAFEKALKGRRVVSAGNQGKYFWLELDAAPHPVMHLGMTGWVHIRDVQTEYNRYAEKTKATEKDIWPPKFWKFHLETEAGPGDTPVVCVAYTDWRRFGRIRLVDCPGPEIRSHSPLVENGPDPVVDRSVFTEEYLRQRMKARHVPIKALLLDQAMISGIGNWVGDEIMYQVFLKSLLAKYAYGQPHLSCMKDLVNLTIIGCATSRAV